MLSQILETVMLICFGISWPISVYKNFKSKSTAGKSVIFMLAIIVGYIAGIAAKFISGNLNYVLIIYFINLIMVSTDLMIYFKNKAYERKLNADDINTNGNKAMEKAA